MKWLTYGVIAVAMAASLLKFTLSSVEYNSRQKYPSYYKDFLNNPRRPYNHTVFDQPQHVVDMVTDVVDFEKEKCETKGLCVRREYAVIDGIWHLYPFYKHRGVFNNITETMLPIAEKLAGEKLEQVALFGVREYHKDAYLRMHFDKRDTHIYGVSCLHGKDHDWHFRTDKDSETSWNIELEPGQCIFYIAADYLHGRPTKFKGDSYMNWYLHYRPWRSEEQKRLDGESDYDLLHGGT